jgi:hypothetical protein
MCVGKILNSPSLRNSAEPDVDQPIEAEHHPPVKASLRGPET